MSDDTVFPTLEDIRFRHTPEGKEGWQYVARFDPNSLRDIADMRTFCRFLTGRTSPDKFEVIQEEDPSGKAVQLYLIIAPESDVSVAAWELLEEAEGDQPLDPVVYEEVVGQWTQQAWTNATLFLRLDWIEEADDTDTSVVLDKEVPNGVAELLYRDRPD